MGKSDDEPEDIPSNPFSQSVSSAEELAKARAQLVEWLQSDSGSSDSALDRTARAQQSEWLKILYETKRQTLQRDLDRSWGVQQFMLPLSLAPLLGIAARQSLTVLQVGALACASCLLLFISNVYVQRLTWHQHRSDVWLRAIEAEIGLEQMRTVPELDLPPWKPRRYRFTIYRRGLLLILIVIWIALAVAADRGSL